MFRSFVFRLFGREPALISAVVAMALKFATAFGLDVSVAVQSGVNAVAAAVVGLVVAWRVKDGLQAAVLGFAQAAMALAVGLGWSWSADRQAVVMSFVGLLVAAFVRQNVTAPVPAPQDAEAVTGGA